MRQNWRHLLFLHWAIPVAELRELVPEELEIDTFGGQAYVGLVPFTMNGVRPSWAPAIPTLSSFHEINVRTYVLKNGADPGVWFFSLDAANSIAVRLARSIWRLPYYYARMSLEHSPPMANFAGDIRYRTDRIWPEPTPAYCAARYEPTGSIAPAEMGTLEFFLVERYLLYSRDEQGALYRGQVHHQPYPLQSARIHLLDENLVHAAGIQRPDVRPLVHYSGGVNVEIFPLRRIDTCDRESNRNGN